MSARPGPARRLGSASPCRGTCRFDAASGYCLDCGRLGTEIGEWLGADPVRRGAICADAAARLVARPERE